MTRLQARALARLPLPKNEVERIYLQADTDARRTYLLASLVRLCESHERLRAEVDGLTILLEERETSS